MAASKFSLQAPETFQAKVAIPMAGGKPGHIEFTFKYRPRSELDAFLKAITPETKDADLILGIASGWDLSDPFTQENIALLVDRYMAAPKAILDTYLQELTQAKQKN